MADTPFELSMDEYVRQNLHLERSVQFRNRQGGWENTTLLPLQEGDTLFRVSFRVVNKGIETYVKNVELRVTSAYGGNLSMFDNEQMNGNPQGQINKGFQNPLGPGQSTPLRS